MKRREKILLIFIVLISLCTVFYYVNASDIWQTGRDFIGVGVNKTGGIRN